MNEQTLHQLLQTYHVPAHIRDHMNKVSAVALFIGQKLRLKGEQVDLIILRHAAMLHDMLKVCDFKELDLTYFPKNYTFEDIQIWNELITKYHDLSHEKAASEILKEMNEPVLAEIVKKHNLGTIIDQRAEERPSTWEEKLVYYADKRVKHDQIVSIAERLEDGRQRYFSDGKIPEDNPLIEKALYQLEEEICNRANIKPSDINEASVRIYIST